jgi:hypothetical protein
MTDLIMPPNPVRLMRDRVCLHQPRCPDARAPDRVAAQPLARHPEQGWSLLCNGLVLFDDGGQLLPDGRAVFPAAAYTAAA